MLLLLLFSLCLAARPVGDRPNIVILFADDLGYGDTRHTGHPSLYTPNLFRLSQEGKTMTNWYTGSPICTPSRACLMTGRLAVRTGMSPPLGGVAQCDAEGGLPANETTLADQLKLNNYKTGIVGKWHLGQRPQYLPTRRGFDSYFGIPFSVDMGGLLHHPHPSCTYLPLLRNETVEQQPVDLYTLADRYATEATNFIEKNKNDPFFLYMAFSHVHVTIPPVIQYAGPKFAGKSKRGPFGDAVEELDWVLGQIMDKLRQEKLDSNTIVYFTSDNGPWLEKKTWAGSEGLFTGMFAHKNYTDTGKASTWEGGVREPAIVWWPGKIAAGSISEEVVSSMDIFTTSILLSGGKVPTDRVIDGKDIRPILFNDGPSPHEFLFIYRGTTLFAVRYRGFKAHFKTKSGYGRDAVVNWNPPLLFNVEMDPSEEFPLPAAAHQDIIKKIENAIIEHQKHVVPQPDHISAHDPKYAICCNKANDCMCGQERLLMNF